MNLTRYKTKIVNFKLLKKHNIILKNLMIKNK